MTTKDDLKLKHIEEKMEQLKAQKQALVNRKRASEKKARLSRLIKYGELVEKYFDCDGKSLDEVESLFQKLANHT